MHTLLSKEICFFLSGSHRWNHLVEGLVYWVPGGLSTKMGAAKARPVLCDPVCPSYQEEVLALRSCSEITADDHCVVEPCACPSSFMDGSGTFLGLAQHIPLCTTPWPAESQATPSPSSPRAWLPCPGRRRGLLAKSSHSPGLGVLSITPMQRTHPPVTSDQGSRKGGSRLSRVGFRSLSPSFLLCLHGACHKRALGTVPTRWGWQMAAKQRCCVITSLLSPSLA